ncbi:hypothetical protein MMC30_007314 [Trapelia coarctata]|nr:hypothetical protein [Trapelia coarctata]
MNGAALYRCVESALNGSDVDSRIITPFKDTYLTASSGVILNPEFPAMVVYATTIDEISPLVKCGLATGFHVTPRSGGHHFENWSALNGTLVVDISHINYVSVSSDLSTATVGAGARLGAVYSILGQYGRTWIAGICPSVGIGGYFTCGGYNMQMRAFGMAADWVASAKVVLATGEMVTVSPTSHPDLWFAMRGGGIFAFTVEATLKTAILPRSAMLYMEFNGKATRVESTQKYLDWAPKQDPLFNSQLNLWNNRTMVLGWYVGKTVAELTAIVRTSGLMDIPGAVVKISGNCSTENSRNFWLYTQQTCTDDATAHAAFDTWFNVIPDDILPPMNATAYSFNDVPAIPNETQANLFPRMALINKTYFTIKSSPLSEADIAYIVEKSGELPDEAMFWTEMTSFNISAPATTSAFPWQEEATALFRFQVGKTGNATLDAIGKAFMSDLDSYLIPRIGNATYAGYIDAHISTNPWTSYYGSNVCKLVSIKKRYDPTSFFSNPFTIPPTAPPGVTC